MFSVLNNYAHKSALRNSNKKLDFDWYRKGLDLRRNNSLLLTQTELCCTTSISPSSKSMMDMPVSCRLHGMCSDRMDMKLILLLTGYISSLCVAWTGRISSDICTSSLFLLEHHFLLGTDGMSCHEEFEAVRRHKSRVLNYVKAMLMCKSLRVTSSMAIIFPPTSFRPWRQGNANNSVG